MSVVAAVASIVGKWQHSPQPPPLPVATPVASSEVASGPLTEGAVAVKPVAVSIIIFPFLDALFP